MLSQHTTILKQSSQGQAGLCLADEAVNGNVNHGDFRIDHRVLRSQCSFITRRHPFLSILVRALEKPTSG